MFEHGIYDDQQFAHTGHHGHVWSFARCTQPHVKVFDNRIAFAGSQHRHKLRCPHVSPSAPDRAFASECAAVSVERGDPNQGRDLLTAQGAELR